jgi:hydroxyacylglutathione hydrolase
MALIQCFTGGMAATNGWVLDTPGGALLFDAPEGIAGWLKQRGIKIVALLLTHQHWDHVSDAAAVARDHECPIYAWWAMHDDLTLISLMKRNMGLEVKLEPYAVNMVLDGQDQITVAGTTFHLLHTPGHSLDSVCFYTPELALCFDGDVLMAGGMGRTDFPGGSTELLLSGITTKLMSLPDGTRLFPGHGPDTTVGDERATNPYL